MRRAQVRVPKGHLVVGVPEDLLQRAETAAPHDEVRGEGMAEVVEPERLDAGAIERRREGRTDLAPCNTVPPREDTPAPSVRTRLQRDERIVDGTIHRDAARLAA